jgi:hypothetical protein
LNADLYTALQPSCEGEGGGTNFESITRLRDGAAWQQADAEINRAWSLRAGSYELKNNPGAQVTYHSVPLQKGETASLRPQVLALMLAAGCILLIACANLAGLTLVRMMRRASEVATRLALGASRWQIQKQFWIETCCWRWWAEWLASVWASSPCAACCCCCPNTFSRSRTSLSTDA